MPTTCMQVPDFDGSAAAGRGHGASMAAAAAGQAIRSFSSAMLATAPTTPLSVAMRSAVAFVTATASGSAERGGHMGPGVVDIENEECVTLMTSDHL